MSMESIEELAIIEVEPEISLVTVHGSVSPETMRVITKLEGKAVVALLDTGSTHNFINSQVVHWLSIKFSNTQLVNVKVNSGRKMVSLGYCKDVSVSTQGLIFLINFFVLDLNDYESLNG